MGKRRAGLRFDEHQELGRELSELHRRLVRLSVRLGNAYTARLSDRCSRVVQELSRLRSELDELVFREHPHLETRELADVYYGHEDVAPAATAE